MKVLLYICLCIVVLMNCVRTLEEISEDSNRVMTCAWGCISLAALFAIPILIEF